MKKECNRTGVILTLIFLLFFSAGLSGQEQYRVGCVAFYNFENLFDTEDDPDIRDEEFTPEGDNRWTEERYRAKLDKLAEVVASIGTELTPDGAAILGTAEIENRRVLADFVRHPGIRDRDYHIVHYDSPDRRGIDVALLYQPKYFQVTASRAIPVNLKDDSGEPVHTRDILFVSGEFDGEPLHLFVNHWPSRRGGARATEAYRNAAALLCKTVSDSLVAADPNAKIIVMGDLNDDPVNASVRQVLQAQRKPGRVRPGQFFNPMYDLYKKGIGTLAYQDAWSLFDQLLLSYGLVQKDAPGYRFYKVHVYNEEHLVQRSGHFQGYPFRTYAGSTYLGGYSDHFPVSVMLVRPVKE